MKQQQGWSRDQVIKFYDHFGLRQDKQGYYEDIALADLIKNAQFDKAQAVIELGCGTGRFAEQLLADHLTKKASYWGCDVSTTMLNLTRRRLFPFGDRVTLWQSTGEMDLQLPDSSADRFIANYVLDILSYDEIAAVIDDARRFLQPNGLLCLVSLTFGSGCFSKIWTAFWQARFLLNPAWVGGCRPVALLGFLSKERWDISHHKIVTARGISSEVVVARRR